ncbi:hypothetical protein [Brevibacillus fulvus]|uniref:DNA-binding transcriptional regulator YdaS (Cro superfamily) n=1 Tax=Brevibacillus fulvus TaxID=1125967 RepID=A0A938Y2A0_9BACL|nr:hypothetical protein [Brevibacillus fulvus]MBM7591074.1 DNA-binding transcriptional regulator YdaS (Cro superfamily) [Brevibacillus fulvus]
MYRSSVHDMAQAHHQQAQFHQFHADAHQQQAQFHRQQADMHRQQALSYGPNAAFNQNYSSRQTAYADQVSPVALVFHGQVTPQALASLQQFHNPYALQNPGANLAPHAAHAVDNRSALNLGHRF